jgi:hypothetical protein
VVWIKSECVQKVSCAGSLVFNVAMVRSGGLFKREFQWKVTRSLGTLPTEGFTIVLWDQLVMESKLL